MWSGRGRKKVRRVGGKLVAQLPAALGLLGRLLLDRRVPVSSKALVAAVAVYVVSPIDLIPDFLGIFGLSDDVFLVALALRRLVLTSGDEVVRSNWRGTDEGLDALYGSMEELGEVVPGPVRRALRGYARRW